MPVSEEIAREQLKTEQFIEVCSTGAGSYL